MSASTDPLTVTTAAHAKGIALHWNGVIEADLDCRIQYADATALQLLGKPLNLILGRQPTTLGLPEATAARLDACLRQVIDGRRPCTVFLLLPYSFGLREVEATFDALRGEGNAPEGVLGIFRVLGNPRADRTECIRHTPALTREHFTQRIQMLIEAGSACPLIAALSIGASASSGMPDAQASRLDSAATYLRKILRPKDLLSLLGDDRLGIAIVDGTDQLSDETAAERILQLPAQHSGILGTEADGVYGVGLSRCADDARDADQLIRNAEFALDVAVAAGSGTWIAYSHSLREDGYARLEMLDELQAGLSRGELFLQYQPQVDLLTGEIVGAEALVRWRHPKRGLIPPGRFIPLAEDSHLIERIGEWVLDAVCRQAKEWADQGIRPLRLGINLSARHFRRRDLLVRVADMLQACGLGPSRIELEITESGAMEDAEAVIATMHRLREFGLRIALDDFGTGYSSLSHLSRLPANTVKIDRAFVTDVVSNPVTAAIATATIAMAHSLGMSVIAEGVETDAQLAWLRRKRCDEIQGYLFSKPLDADIFASRVQAGDRLHTPASHGELHSPTILLVDDESNILSSLQRQFYRDGYHILTAGSPAEAFEVLALNPVHVVISDQRMPGMRGTEFLGRVKDLYPGTVRMILSGSTEISTVTEAINRGAVAKYFVKPCDFEYLREEVRQVFRGIGDSTQDCR